MAGRYTRFILISIVMTTGMSCVGQQLVDKQATHETRMLFMNLKYLSERNVMFGHHEDLAYGVGWVGVEGRSDVKDVCGDYPAVHGWDLGKEDRGKNIDNVPFANMNQWIKETYERGGINTISWHVDNPSSGGNAWDTVKTVKYILPGGKDHEAFKRRLDKIATLLEGYQSGRVKIPLIFRPYHEHNGNWFWWGKGNCTEEEYITLWRFTVDYLRKEKKIHNLIFAFSPDRSRLDMTDIKGSYLYGYPGDEYVDILGFDDYMDVGISWNKKPKDDQVNDLLLSLRTISNLAKEKNKLAALTETGLEGVTQERWYTETILNPLKMDKTIQVSYIMVWRNASEKHHYAPYPNHTSVQDFIKFYSDDYTLFEKDLPNVYKSKLK
jgi:mannan endo-1,4-beta-mannosidase